MEDSDQTTARDFWLNDYLLNLAMLEKGILEHLLESSLESRPAEDLEDL